MQRVDNANPRDKSLSRVAYTGHKINFFSMNHLAPKYFKVVANS